MAVLDHAEGAAGLGALGAFAVDAEVALYAYPFCAVLALIIAARTRRIGPSLLLAFSGPHAVSWFAGILGAVPWIMRSEPPAGVTSFAALVALASPLYLFAACAILSAYALRKRRALSRGTTVMAFVALLVAHLLNFLVMIVAAA